MPTERFALWEEILEGERCDNFKLISYADIDFEHGNGTIMYELYDAEGMKFVKMRNDFEITNPLLSSISILTVSSAIAICVGGTLLGAVTGDLYDCYKQSQQDHPNYNMHERCRDTFQRYRNKGNKINGAAVGAFATCLYGFGVNP